MKKIAWAFLLISVFLISPDILYKRIDYRKGKSRNVCKIFKDDVLLYIIFVDSKQTSPWTEFDMQTTMDSVKMAVSWLQMQAGKKGISLNIITDYYLGAQVAPISKMLPEESVLKTVITPNVKTGIENLNKWTDYIARKAGETFNIVDKEGVPEVKKPKNKERLIAYLRDQHKVESVALLLMVNNYYKDDVSLTLNNMSSDDIEYSIVSYKYPSEIAHTILHLFGGADMCESIYRKNVKNISFAASEWPDDIMQNVFARNISTLTISPYTEYLIGWSEKLDSKYHVLLQDKMMR